MSSTYRIVQVGPQDSSEGRFQGLNVAHIVVTGTRSSRFRPASPV